MKRVQFYVCPGCGNILTATGKGEIVCCGRRLEPLCPSAPDADHRPEISLVETDDYITFSHPMRKDHYLKFTACVTCDRLALTRLYPEQEAAVRFPRMGGGTLYFYCVKHGHTAEAVTGFAGKGEALRLPLLRSPDRMIV